MNGLRVALIPSALVVIPARTTGPGAVGLMDRVCGCHVVSLFTGLMTKRPAHILLWGHDSHMRGTHTTPHLAQMVKMFARRDRADHPFIDGAMSADGFPVLVGGSVSTFCFASLPDPARRGKSSVFLDIFNRRRSALMPSDEADRLPLDPPVAGVGSGRNVGAFAAATMATTMRDAIVCRWHFGDLPYRSLRCCRASGGCNRAEAFVFGILP
jgi:hypothetical protein